MVLYKNGQVFATSKSSSLFELDLELRTTKQYPPITHTQPYTIDANESYIAVGYGDIGVVNVYDRKTRGFPSHTFRHDDNASSDGSSVFRTIINNDLIFSCASDTKVICWKPSERKVKYFIQHDAQVQDIIIGRKGTPLKNKIISADWYNFCKISSLQTGKGIRKIALGYQCSSLTADKAQTLIAAGLSRGAGKVILIDTKTLRIVKQVVLDIDTMICSLAFNRRNDTLLAVTTDARVGISEVYSLKFRQTLA